MCNFRVGQKVVCDAPKGFEQAEHETCISPKHGEVYTIREIEVDADGQWLRLHEIVNPPETYDVGGYGETAFHGSGFRPVVERKTDISIFKAMLNTTPETVGA